MNATMNDVGFYGSGSLGRSTVADAQSVSPAELLGVWERGQQQIPVERALTMLAVACPGARRETLAGLSIGRRDALLIELREKLFGAELTSLADCPACGERLEMSFKAADISISLPVESDQELSFDRSGYELRLRLPNSLDLLAVAECGSHVEMRRRLFEQCVLSVAHQGEPGVSANITEEIPREVVDLAIERIAEADPQADVQVDLICPCCRHRWQLAFDIVSYLWTELQAWAARLLGEVHLLASAYGWSESDILTMSWWRRRRYLEMVAG